MLRFLVVTGMCSLGFGLTSTISFLTEDPEIKQNAYILQYVFSLYYGNRVQGYPYQSQSDLLDCVKV